jgi:uncharacterized protein YndB with AHSA1/START domain
MSKFVRIAQTSQALSLTAMEEASRQGLRQADLEHLFLALVLSDQPAGEVLRELGISIDVARRAVEDQHAAQLASLGIHTELPEPGRIVFHETDGYEWSKRASDLIARASGKGLDGSAAAVLRELVIEPSGLIAELLRHVGTTPADVVDRLDRLPAPPERREPAHEKGRAVGSSDTFVPGPIEHVWEFLADPARVPEWAPGIGSVDLTDADTPGTVWTGYAPTSRPDGKPVRLKEEFRRRGLQLLDARHPDRVAWRFTSPDTAKSRPIVTEFALTPVAGGTQVTITTSWSRHQGWRRLLGFPLRPAQRFLIWITLFQIGGAISRAFR